MKSSRRRKGFERAGGLRPAVLGLKRPSTLRLQAALAWREVAGPALSRGVRVEFARGLFDIVVESAEMEALLAPVVAEICGRIAGRYPGLGLKRWRVRAQGGQVAGRSSTPVVALPPTDERATDDSPPRKRADRRTESSAVAPSTEELEQRLVAISRRMLERQKP